MYIRNGEVAASGHTEAEMRTAIHFYFLFIQTSDMQSVVLGVSPPHFQHIHTGIKRNPRLTE